MMDVLLRPLSEDADDWESLVVGSHAEAPAFVSVGTRAWVCGSVLDGGFVLSLRTQANHTKERTAVGARQPGGRAMPFAILAPTTTRQTDSSDVMIMVVVEGTRRRSQFSNAVAW